MGEECGGRIVDGLGKGVAAIGIGELVGKGWVGLGLPSLARLHLLVLGVGGALRGVLVDVPEALEGPRGNERVRLHLRLRTLAAQAILDAR